MVPTQIIWNKIVIEEKNLLKNVYFAICIKLTQSTYPALTALASLNSEEF